LADSALEISVTFDPSHSWEPLLGDEEGSVSSAGSKKKWPELEEKNQLFLLLLHRRKFRKVFNFSISSTRSLQEAFQQMDVDGDGKLSRKEVETALGKILTEQDLETLLVDLDADQDGEVDWQEFLHVMKQRMREPESVKMLKEAFR